MPASTASAFINLVPIAGALLAVLAGEALSLAEIGGGLLALAGVWLSAQGAGTRRAAGEANA